MSPKRWLSTSSRRRSTVSGGVDPDGLPTRKLVIVGDGTCGKTSLLFAFTRDEFFGDVYVPTIFETSIVDMEIKPGKVIALSLWDTAGQEAYARLRPLSYTDTHVVLICFALDSWDSFNNVRECWYPEVRHYCPGADILLIGCKSDLVGSPGGIDCVTREAAEKLAVSIGAKACFLCSAKTRDCVTDVFETAATVAYNAGKRKSRLRLSGCLGKRK